MIKKLSENILDKFSMDFLRSQGLKNAYGNNGHGDCHTGSPGTSDLVSLFWMGTPGLFMISFFCWDAFCW